MNQDWRVTIIEEGYKATLKANHPDRFPAEQRARQDDICKGLALTKDHLLEMVRTWHSPKDCASPLAAAIRQRAGDGGQRPQQTVIIPPPFDAFIDLGFAFLETFFPTVKPQKKTKRPRRSINVRA